MTTTEITEAPTSLDAVFDCAADAIVRGEFKGSPPWAQASAAILKVTELIGLAERTDVQVAASTLLWAETGGKTFYEYEQRDVRKFVRLYRRIARNVRANV